MKLIHKTLILGLVLFGGMAMAEEEATDPVVIARQDLMKANGAAVKVLGDMVKGTTPFDAAAAEAAKARLIEDAKAIPATFQAQSSDPGSEAKPEVWTNWDDFVAKAEALASAAQAVDATSVEGLTNGLGTVGGTCKACHTAYRM